MALNYNNAQAVANGAEAWFKIKTDLKARGWTVARSSDGTTYNAAGDQITLAGTGAGGMNNNSAWFELVSPDASVHIAVQRGTSETVWRAKVSQNAFTGGTPNATTVGTATDQFHLRGADAPTYVTMFGTAGTYKLTTIVDDAAPYGFMAFCTNTGGTATSMMFGRDPYVNPDGTQVQPYAYWCSTTSFGLPNAVVSGSCFSTSHGGAPLAYGNATQAPAVGVMFRSIFNTGGSNTPQTNAGGTYVTTGEDALLSVEYGRAAGDAAPVGFFGVSYFLRQDIAVRPCADYVIIAGKRDWMGLGSGLMIRWNDTTPAW